jgi:hypothetical protein
LSGFADYAKASSQNCKFLAGRLAVFCNFATRIKPAKSLLQRSKRQFDFGLFPLRFAIVHETDWFSGLFGSSSEFFTDD